MQHGQLLSHVDTDLVTREQLALVETPDPTRSFKPVPHIELIDTLDKVLRQNQIAIRKEQFALRRDGSTLFGVLQLAYENTEDGSPLSASEPPITRPCRSRFVPGSRCLSATTWCSAGI
jgi:hypothetical protein